MRYRAATRFAGIAVSLASALGACASSSSGESSIESTMRENIGHTVASTPDVSIEPGTLNAQTEEIQPGLSSSNLFPIVRNDTTVAEAAAAFGCIGHTKTAPVNLQQFDGKAPNFDDLFTPYARPWLVKIEEAGVTSGRLVRPKGADLAWIEEDLRLYDTPSQAFTTATLLDPRWSTLSSIWRESLNYGLGRFNDGQEPVDAAYESLNQYLAALTSACRQAIKASIERAHEVGLEFSSYIYIQLVEYLTEWHPKWFTQASVDEFESQFEIRDN